MLMSSGFTDDLFPVDETIRYYNRTKGTYPESDLALFFGDFGHPRSANGKDDVVDDLRAREEAWFDHYIKGEGAEPAQGATSYTQTCPSDAPSAGPYSAASWAASAPGEIRYRDEGEQTIAADSTTGGQFNPVGSNACTTAPADDTAGAAVYRLDAAPAGGYTLLGAGTVIARYEVGSDTSQIAARLLDVAPDGTQTLVNRGLWRPAAGRRQAGLPAPPERLDVRRGPRAEARAARRRRRRPSRSPATAAPPTGRRRSRSRT